MRCVNRVTLLGFMGGAPSMVVTGRGIKKARRDTREFSLLDSKPVGSSASAPLPAGSVAGEESALKNSSRHSN